MEDRNLKDYAVANISEEDVLSITELEKALSSRDHKDIVLIAYQPKDKAGA